MTFKNSAYFCTRLVSKMLLRIGALRISQVLHGISVILELLLGFFIAHFRVIRTGSSLLVVAGGATSICNLSLITTPVLIVIGRVGHTSYLKYYRIVLIKYLSSK